MPKLSALSTVIATMLATSLAAPAIAQSNENEGEFQLERFRPSLDRDGLLDVESGKATPHLNYDVGLWFNYSANPLVFRFNDASGAAQRGAIVGNRIGGNLVGSIGLFDVVEVGLDVPFVLYQDRNVSAAFIGETVGSGGLGDLRLVPKVAIPNPVLDLSILAGVTIPTATDKNAYLGERTFTISPELAASKAFLGHFRAAANLGIKFRGEYDMLDLRVGPELYYRAGVGYRLHETAQVPLELAVTFNGGNVLPVENVNQNPLEFLLGGTYDIGDRMQVMGGLGTGIVPGFGTPDFRMFVGARYAPRTSGAATNDPPSSTDSDGDGVEDARDACPERPANTANGCPPAAVDDDGDGLMNPDDRCPRDPEDKDGFQDDDGCPDPDNDGDGIVDADDKAPNDPEDKDGFQDDDGVPDPDNDGDGILDINDRAPIDPEDMDGFEDEDGMPEIDNDRDGIVDTADKCPNEAEVVNGVDDTDGCPDEGKSLVVLKKNKIEVLDKVYFASGKAALQPRSFNLLKQVAALLKNYPKITRLDVQGHTDSAGADAFNLDLSQRRAKAVMDFLVGEGIAPERLESHGYGETKPLVPNDSPTNMARNRRTDFAIAEFDGKPVKNGAVETTEAQPVQPE